MHANHLIDVFPIISDQVDSRELLVILRLAENVMQKNSYAHFVEFGCYIGTTSLFIQRLIDVYGYNGEYHVYDSFQGLPEKSSPDLSPAGDQFRAGELSVSKKKFLMQFKKAGLRPPYVHKGWFRDLRSADVPNDIAFAFLDGDYYESIITPLRLIWPKLSANAVVVVDDYANEALPGAKKAIDEWLQSHAATLRVEKSLAIITLP